MGLRIRTNTASVGAQKELGETTDRMNDSMRKLSSGFRINKAADDAAGLAISENMRAQLRSMSQAKRNASDGVSMIQVAEGSMNEVSNILVRLRELSIQSASDTIGNLERSFANKEYVQLVDEIDRISNSTDFNGLMLLQGGNASGDMESLTVHVGPGDGLAENSDTVSIDMQQMKINAAEILGLGKESEIGNIEPGGEFSRAQASEKLAVIDSALERINGMRAELGSKQARLGSVIANLSTAEENVGAARSRIRDVDFASETATFTQSRILQQGGATILAQANSTPELALTLLR